MDLYISITAGLLLLLQGCHVALLQDPTNSPGRTIDKSWLRQPVKTAIHDTTQHNGEVDEDGVESTDDQGFGILQGSIFSGEDEVQDQGANITGVVAIGTTMPPGIMPNDTAVDPESPSTTVAQTPPVSVPLNSSQASNATAEDSEESQNTTKPLQDTTTHPVTQSSNGSASNGSDINDMTMVPETNSTAEAGPASDNDTWVTNGTADGVNDTTTEVPESEPSTASPTSELPPGTTTAEIIPETTTTTAPSTSVIVNTPTIDSASGSNSERGLASEVSRRKRSEAWGAILGTAVAIAFVGLVVYVILRRRGQRDFTHRKLVEEFPSDPVLRLDNNEPLDLKFDGSAYYNPGLQMDNIQMTNFPQGR